MSEPSAIVPGMTDIGPLAAGARARFGTAAAHATVRSGRTVHAVQLGQWVGAELAPELLCHTGVSGWDPDVLRPTSAPVTCARCLRILGASIAPAATQLSLFGPAAVPSASQRTSAATSSPSPSSASTADV